MTIPQLDSGAIAKSFGAKIDLGISDIGLCLVVGRDASVRAAIRAHGARAVAELGGDRLLCLATLEQMSRLRGDPSVHLVGPVSIDNDRLRRFGELVGAPAVQ